MEHGTPTVEHDDGVASAALFAALANADRLAMLAVLSSAQSADRRDHGLSIAELATCTEISRFAASRHLAILRRAGLVEARIVGRRALHHLKSASFEKLEDWLNLFIDGGDWGDGPH